METAKPEYHLIYTVSYQDMIQLWIETIHPDGHVVAIWDARNHLDLLKKCGFQIDEAKLFDNKVLVVQTHELENTFSALALINKFDHGPFIQIYSNGALVTDNIDTISIPNTN